MWTSSCSACCMASVLDIAQHGKAGFGVVEHVPRLAAAGLDRLHVVLDADDRVGKSVGFFLREPAGRRAFRMPA